MIVINKDRTMNLSYSSYGCKWYITNYKIDEKDIFVLKCDDMSVETFETKDDAINCLDDIRQAWLNDCDTFNIE